ncbi:MAG: thiamine pyrophosphate-binding protein, partial [Pseudomonadota bacterium]|nr:thiamine pyrophosphate-binding protein [Pseudomonadota bacterium]
MSKTKPTVGEALVSGLKQRGVDCVFGIPGVHTIELYRGLDLDGIRHVTPRHEQGAGFMADGYARASGKPGVAFVITGPGLTNTITPVAQSRADSVPVLVVSGVNARATLGQGMGHLHELPDQQGLMQTVVAASEHVNEPNALNGALTRAFDAMQAARPTPAHIEVPLDVAGVTAAPLAPP